MKGKRGEYQEIVDFGNLIFSQATVPHHFDKLIPKLYQEGTHAEEFHYIVKEDGKIRAMLCAYPTELCVGGRTLKIAGVGTVAVHPSCRGKGYMQLLMNAAIEDMKKDGIDFSMLGGQRQRYEYFGYEPCGVDIDFLVSETNIRHACKSLEDAGIVIHKILDDSSLDIPSIILLQEQQLIHGVRSKEEFYKICKSWMADLYAIKQSDEVIGYFCMRESTIYELVVKDKTLIKKSSKAILSQLSLDKISFSTGATSVDLLSEMQDIWECSSISNNKSVLIFNYTDVIRAFLEVKSKCTTLADGTFIMDILEYGKIKISIDNNCIAVDRLDDLPTNESDSHIVMDQRKATAFLFSSTKYFSDYGMEIPAFANNWFPLPMFVPRIDVV